MKLQLKRPLVFFDIESTGLDVATDRIVELSLLKVFPDGHTETRTQRFNPQRPISADASQVTGITDADVADCPTFASQAKHVAGFIAGCDLAGFNSNRFDVPMLVEELCRAGIDFDLGAVSFIDVQTIFHKKEPRTLSAAYRFYVGGELENAHAAEADTVAAFEVLKGQLERYEDLPADVEGLAEFTANGRNVDLAGRIVKNADGEEVINFGRYRGKTVRSVARLEPSFFNWIQQADFTHDTKRHFMRLYLKYRQQPG